MAHFFPAPGAPRSDYEVDGKLAPDSVSRLTIPHGEVKPIGLFGGRGLTLKLKPEWGSFVARQNLPDGNDILWISMARSSPGFVLETWLGAQRWATLTVVPLTSEAQEKEMRPAPLWSLDQAWIDFQDGFTDGLAQKLDASLLVEISKKVQDDTTGFQVGCLSGLIDGLWAGLKSLLEVVNLAGQVVVLSTPWGVVAEATLNTASESHRRMRQQQMEAAAQFGRQAGLIVKTVRDVVTEIALKPGLYFPQSRTAGLVIGAEIAGMIAREIHLKGSIELGEFVGVILGQVLFEIIVQVALILLTEGAGNVARAGIGAGEGGGFIARLAARLERVFEALPAFRRIILGLRGEAASARAAAAALDAEIELAFGEAAVLQRGARGGFPVLERLPGLTAEEAAATRRLLGQQLDPRLAAAWRACGEGNPQAAREMAEIERLLKTGSAVDREAAYELSEKTYGNWRKRFWTRVRGDESLKKIFTEAGAEFAGGDGTAPFYRLDGTRTKNLTITLDHFVERRVDNPARAVDALNVRPALSFENSATLEAIRKDNFLKGWARP